MDADSESDNLECPDVEAPRISEQLRLNQRAETIKLSAQDSVAFAQALLNPPAPNERLRVAAKRYRSFLTGS